MKASSSKIIIKPRKLRNVEPVEEEPELSEAASPDESEEQEEGVESADEGGDSEGRTESQRDDGEGAEDEETVVKPRRGRGRPPGGGGGGGSSAPTGTGRPRGRPRGSGRGRGRGRGRGATTLLIRLPKLPAEDVAGDETPVAESQADTPAPEEPEPTPEETGPIAGGKPFRRINGEVHVIENDEFVTENDPKGDAKIDANGNLLGGRVFKASTFILPNRHPERKYMLAIDAARTSGFRDSLYYFRRNLLAFKLSATQPEKDYLIEQGKLGSHLRTRSVTLVTARSAFKLHGSKTIIDGIWVVDDYYEERATIEAVSRGMKPGDPVGELPDPLAPTGEAAVRAAADKAAQAGATKGERGTGVGLYRTGGPTTVFGGAGLGPFSDGPLNVAKKAMLNREGVTEENWMMVMAERTQEANHEWAIARKEALKALGGIAGDQPERSGAESDTNTKRHSLTVGEEEADVPKKKKPRKKGLGSAGTLPLGVYEPHSGIVHYRVDTQPSRCRWETLPDDNVKRKVLGGTKVGNGAWALAWVDTIMETPKPEEEDPDTKSRNSLLRAAGQTH